jgi:hypothetical protein
MVKLQTWEIQNQPHTHLNVQTSTVTIYHSYTFRLEGVLKCDLIMFLKNCIFFKLNFLEMFLDFCNVLILKINFKK